MKGKPSLGRAWREEIAIVRRDAKNEAKLWIEQWRAAGRIVEHHPPLYDYGKYRDAGAFFEQELGVDKTTGFSLVRVAHHARAEDVEAHGIWKLDAAIGWFYATHGPVPLQTPIAFDRIVIDGKPLAKLTVAAIKSARKRALAPKGKRRPKHAYGDAIGAALAKHDALGHVHVHEADGFLNFHRVATGAVRLFAEALLRAKLPPHP